LENNAIAFETTMVVQRVMLLMEAAIAWSLSRRRETNINQDRDAARTLGFSSQSLSVATLVPNRMMTITTR
jgi:hypothetical protein